MPRVALVVPVFPPDAGGGVFRALKLAPHLTDAGWEAEVFTVENPGSPQDPTLLAEIPATLPVTRIPPSAAQRLQRGPLRKLGFAFEALGLTASALAQWDHLTEALLERHRRQPFDLLFSSSPPAAPHRAILAVLEQLPEAKRPAWVADFRDPWRRSFTYRPRTDDEAAQDVRDEGRTLYGATVITTTVKASMLATCMEHSLSCDKVTWIPNGYDPADLANLPPAPLPPSPLAREQPLRLGYAGSLYGAYNLDRLLEAIAFLPQTHPELAGAIHLDLLGPRNKQTLERLHELQLEEAVTLHGYLPHREALRTLAACHWVLVAMPHDPRAQDTVPGKLYEYLAARMPVLAYAAADGMIARLIQETQGGVLVSAREPAAIAAQLGALCNRPPGASQLPPPPPEFPRFLAQYSRETTAREFAQSFERALMLTKGARV